MLRKNQLERKCIYKNRLGKNGEEHAKNYLISNGLKFVTANFRYDRAEIDLIFEDEKNRTLIFVEVKTRRNKNFGEPEESLTFSKQEQIRKAATGFVVENEYYSEHDLRIDVMSIYIENEKMTINHIPNAF